MTTNKQRVESLLGDFIVIKETYSRLCQEGPQEDRKYYDGRQLMCIEIVQELRSLLRNWEE